MRNKIVIDTGLIVALFDASDHYSRTAVHWVESNTGLLYTHWSVVTEAQHLLDFHIQAQLDCLQWIQQAVKIMPASVDDLTRISQLMKKYADVPMDFADAALVNLCETLETPYIATLDSDFQIYRFQGKKHFKNVFTA